MNSSPICYSTSGGFPFLVPFASKVIQGVHVDKCNIRVHRVEGDNFFREKTMKKPLLEIGFLSVLLLSVPCAGQGTSHRFDLQSKANGVKYTIEVVLPSDPASNGPKYPVLYCY
jgi:hypothetical protein